MVAPKVGQPRIKSSFMRGGLGRCDGSDRITSRVPRAYDYTGGLAREEAPMLRSTFYPKLANHEERRSLFIFQTERQIAAYLDALRPPDGSVLADTAYAYSVVLASRNPKQFVITSDRDFQSAVADPTGHHVQYLLVPAPNLGPADALNRHWPGLYGSGSRVGILVKEWHGAYFGDWRLYRVRS